MQFLGKGAAALVSMAVLAAGAQAQTVLIANEPGPNRGVRAEAVEFIGQQFAERSGGSLRVDQNWGGAVFKINAALTSISTGVADLGLIIGAYAESEFPELAMGDLPFRDTDPWVMMMAMNDMFKSNAQIQQRLDDLSLVYIAPFATSQGMLGCKGKDVRSAADIRGTKTRYAGSFGDIFSNLGGNMIDMSIYEAAQGIETGLLECTLTYPYFAVATKLDDMLDSITPMSFNGSSSLATFMNKFTFDSLSPEEQEIVTGMSVEVIDFYSERLFDADEKAWVTMREEKNIPIHELGPDDYEAFDAAAQPMIDRWKANATANGYDAAALLAELEAKIAEYTAIKETQGYPWERN